ncbi:MAG: FliM/FliN family flagellar motor switch protein [Gemmatimonadota bacterium]
MSTEALTEENVESQAEEAADESVAPRRGAVATREPTPYDFRRPHRVSKERLRTLEAMYERLVKSVEGWMMGRVRGQVELTLQGVEQLSFADFTLSLSTPCCSYLIEIRDSGGQLGVIDFGSEFAFYLVDRLLGGRAKVEKLNRALTPIERMVVRTVAERITNGVREIWEDYIRLELGVSGFESVPEILRATSGDAPVLVATIGITAGGEESTISVCLPFAVLDTFFADAAVHRRVSVTGSEEERRANRRVVEGSLRVTHLPLSARLPEFRISMRNLTSLAEGSVLATGLTRETELEIHVSGKARFSGKPARVGKKLAVSVMDTISDLPLDLEGESNVNLFEEEL